MQILRDAGTAASLHGSCEGSSAGVTGRAEISGGGFSQGIVALRAHRRRTARASCGPRGVAGPQRRGDKRVARGRLLRRLRARGASRDERSPHLPSVQPPPAAHWQRQLAIGRAHFPWCEIEQAAATLREAYAAKCSAASGGNWLFCMSQKQTDRRKPSTDLCAHFGELLAYAA